MKLSRSEVGLPPRTSTHTCILHTRSFGLQYSTNCAVTMFQKQKRYALPRQLDVDPLPEETHVDPTKSCTCKPKNATAQPFTSRRKQAFQNHKTLSKRQAVRGEKEACDPLLPAQQLFLLLRPPFCLRNSLDPDSSGFVLLSDNGFAR